MAVLAGTAVAVALIAMPVGLLETVVASSGLSEAVPAAAPPLGLTARLSLAGFAGLLAVGLVGIMRRDPVDADEIEEEGRGERAQGARKMGFAFSKLTALARGRTTPVADADAPVLRRADAHPDAPPRLPIFASRDFDGVEIFARRESGRRPIAMHPEQASDPVRPTPGFAMPRVPVEQPAEVTPPQPVFQRPAFQHPVFAAPVSEPIEASVGATETTSCAQEVSWADIEPFAPEMLEEPEVIEEPEAIEEAIMPEAIAPEPFVMAAREMLTPLPLPTHGLSIAELTDRLERGLASRRRSMSGRPTGVLADMLVAERVPVRKSVAPDADEALRAALGTLRSMAARSR
ncbi:hypothetical protein [Sphingobium sp.]|uniref:hypothetical protein n=1 Tax=Sphingobium sp. TaxID=1912891 RepID=UPI002BCECAC7|nr:hypothetical protein [Sphingobium sp.]HUD90547.1 hypothetical protein [Sphingobium sp.]